MLLRAYATNKIILLFLLSFCLTSCFNSSPEENSRLVSDTLHGQLLIWHSWDGEERVALQKLFDEYTELHPRVRLVEEFYSPSDLEATFPYVVEAGLGPDMLIGPAIWADTLEDEGLILEIDSDKVQEELFLSSALDMLRHDDDIYGLPLSLDTFVLYYNKNLLTKAQTLKSTDNFLSTLIQSRRESITDTQTLATLNELLSEVESLSSEHEQFMLPTDLDDLLRQASQGQTVAIRTDFYGAFWGIRAFGGQLFDEQGRIALNQGGYANWLGWLKHAQENPNVLLNRHADELTALFASGEVAYYVGSTHELTELQTALGEDVVGVVRLPGRPNHPAGPILQTEAIMLNAASTDHNQDLALHIAQYLTHQEQQRKLALTLGKLPANNRVNIDPRISPTLAESIAQSHRAISISLENGPIFNDLADLGDMIYGQALDGDIGLGEAAIILTENVNTLHGLETALIEHILECDVQGTGIMWNTWNGLLQQTLEDLKDNFNQLCPNMAIEIVNIDPAEFDIRYLAAIEAGDVPSLVTRNNQQMSQLASDELLLNLGGLLDPGFQQRFLTLVEQSMLTDGNLYGIPVGLNTLGLYYNKELVRDPPISLDDLLLMATPDTKLALPIGFVDSYWGIAAFSNRNTWLSDEGRFILDPDGLADWLTWLKEAQNRTGIVLSMDSAELKTLFMQEEVAFLVSDANQLGILQSTLGTDKIGVLPLPAGSPLLTVDGVAISSFAPQAEQMVALKFAQFLTEVDSQRLLLEQGQRIPTNVNVQVTDNPPVERFLEQAGIATVIPDRTEVQAIFEWGDLVYEQVLTNNISPQESVADFITVVDAANGFDVIAQIGEESCTESGSITLWHSWTETEASAWEQVIANFIELCPEIQVIPLYVEDSEFNEELNETLEAETDNEEEDELSLPDLFLASQKNLETYQTNRLIQDITELVEQKNLVDDLPKAVRSLTIGDRIYGIPQALHVPALYYHPDQVDALPFSFDSLLAQAEQGMTVALNNRFLDLFWGGAAFDCQPCQSGELVNDQGELLLNESDLAAWKAWLEAATDTGNVFFSTEQTRLERMFLSGQAAYLVAGPAFLNEAQSVLGVANVGLASLPVGEGEQISRPFLGVDSFFFHHETTREQTLLALKFSLFASNEASQTLLMQTANFVPTNDLALVKAKDPALLPFIHEVETSLLWPEESSLLLIQEDNVYRSFDGLANSQ